MILTIILIIYLVSVIGFYFVVRDKFENEWNNSNPRFIDFFVVICPVINTGFLFFSVIDFLFENNFYNWFFKIPKR